MAPYAYQEAAYSLLEGSEVLNLLVASPTGSGKTSVIVHAARLAVERNERIVVAEPLIALVEQVYAKLVSSLPGASVDMRTGPSVKEAHAGLPADVTVCTYEVLASCCTGASNDDARTTTMSLVRRVVIDEFHFIGEDRGPVIQEILDWCRKERAPIVALSGTLINELEVGEFVSGVNGYPTVVVGASRRPVPLNFYYYDCRLNGSNERRFCTLRPRTHWELSGAAAAPDYQKIGGLRGRQDLLRLVAGLRSWDCLPALLVTFSCKKLDNWAEDVASGNDFLTRGQRHMVVRAFKEMLAGIPAEDKVLFERLERLARRGIGLHHSHLPVQYLELVSHLAEHRCLMLVLSTSTLSAGINLPVRTVCLCSARIPKKNAEGGMDHEVLDPLLFHQLAGRAGRPGFETVGNVVVVGMGSEGWTAAAALLERPMTPVRPTSAFCSGDVLRAALTGRQIAMDRLVFSSSEAAQDAEISRASRALWRRAALLVDDEPLLSLAEQACSSAMALLGAPEQVLSEKAGFPTAPAARWLRDKGRRGFEVSAEEAAIKLCENSSSSGRRRAGAVVHASVFDAVLKVREARATLLAVCGADQSPMLLWPLASILRNTKEDEQGLARHAEVEEYATLESRLKDAGFLDKATGAPTRKGKAASHIRSCEKPEVLVDLVLGSMAELSAPEFVRLASLVIASGTKRDDDPPPEEPEHEWEQLLVERLPTATAAFNRATELWASGSSLFEIEAETGVSCGQFARHVVRANSLLCELAYARRELGLGGSRALVDASRSLCRGLPFAKRGGGRVPIGAQPPDDDESESGDDADSAASLLLEELQAFAIASALAGFDDGEASAGAEEHRSV